MSQMTQAEKQHAEPFDLDLWTDMLDAMETAEHVAEQDDSDEKRRDAFDRRQAEAEVNANATYYSGEGDCEW